MRHGVGNASAAPGWDGNWRCTADPMVMKASSEAEAAWGGEASERAAGRSGSQMVGLRQSAPRKRGAISEGCLGVLRGRP